MTGNAGGHETAWAWMAMTGDGFIVIGADGHTIVAGMDGGDGGDFVVGMVGGHKTRPYSIDTR